MNHVIGRKYDIKVIVYRNISLDSVKKIYPVIKEKKQDYRYIGYNTAIQYLDEQIKTIKGWEESDPESFMPDLLLNLRRTKEKIKEHFKVKEHGK